jgi:hypothetical protein
VLWQKLAESEATKRDKRTISAAKPIQYSRQKPGSMLYPIYQLLMAVFSNTFL